MGQSSNMDLVAQRTSESVRERRSGQRQKEVYHAAGCLSALKLLESPLHVTGMTQLPEIANAR